MRSRLRRICIVALLGALPVAALYAQEATWLGDVQVAAQDAVSSTDPALSSAVGMGPGTQGLAGVVQLDLHGRLTYPMGQLSVIDAATWWQGSDGGALQNDLQQAWVSCAPDPALTIVVGKQRIPWATGYAFFPGDRINPPMNPQDRAEGFYGVSATLAPSASFSLAAVVRMDSALAPVSTLPGLAYPAGDGAASLPFLAPYVHAAPADPWLDLRYAIYAEAFLGSLDLHAAVTWQPARVLRPTAGFSLDVLGFILDGSVAVELQDRNLYPQPDGTYSSPAFGVPFPAATAGVQRTVSWETGSFAVTLEYLYDGTGYDPDQEARFLGDLETALGAGSGSSLAAGSLASGAWFSSGEIVPALGRHYGAVSLGALVSRWFAADAALVINLQDLSVAVQADLVLTPLDGIDLFIRAIGAGGPSRRTEFASLPVTVVATAGATVHF